MIEAIIMRSTTVIRWCFADHLRPRKIRCCVAQNFSLHCVKISEIFRPTADAASLPGIEDDTIADTGTILLLKG